MKTRILFCMASVAILVAGLAIINACSKTENPEKSNDFSVQNLSALNNYRPDKGEIADLYHQFLSEIKQTKENTSYKDLIEAVDRPVDEAVWLIETAVNTELGFYNDSIKNINEDTISISLVNKNIGTNGVPVIDGDEILNKFLYIEQYILSQETNGILFWASHIEISDINTLSTGIELIIIEGEENDGDFGLISPWPAGHQIDPFVSPYWNYAGTCSDYMFYAEWDYWRKIAMPGYVHPAPGYIIEYQYYYAPTPYGGEDRLLWDFGNPEYYMLNTTDLNYYMYNLKEVIDDNTNPDPDYFIGYFHIYTTCHGDPVNGTWCPGGYLTYLPWFQQYPGLWTYKTTWVGIPD